MTDDDDVPDYTRTGTRRSQQHRAPAIDSYPRCVECHGHIVGQQDRDGNPRHFECRRDTS